jgi:hypothetical protein
MAHPLIELRRLLSPGKPKQSGTVQRVEGNKVYVSTEKGTVIRDRTGATDYRPGDRVVLIQGELAGKQSRDDAKPTFVL